MKICACGTTDEALATAIRSLELPLKAGDCVIWLSTVINLQVAILMHLTGEDADDTLDRMTRLNLYELVIKSREVNDLIEMERELRDG